ncbi:MAG: hypothetical protein IT378_06930 [Sandaracinaceae bacterium]|nr:hypothetical protein [Sandaracinaceae bacterium]
MGLPIGSAGEIYLSGHLRRRVANTTDDLGEHESIAWCLHEDPGAVFATTDKRAAYLALAELGRDRVASAFDLWLDLNARSLVDRATLDKLCRLTAAKSSPQVPVPFRIQATQSS